MRARIIGIAIAATQLHVGPPAAPRGGTLGAVPPMMLWAWERPEDLRFLRDDDAGVAFLASTVRLDGERARVTPRRQPLRVAYGSYLAAVVRVETSRGAPLSTSDATRETVVREIARVAALPGVREAQIDFDAVRSERDFYVRLLADVRRALPPSITLSMTALASWCSADDWLDAMPLPVDEVVPMLFAMGPDAPKVWRALDADGDFRAARCRTSVGISAQESPRPLPKHRRLYVFNAKPWDATTFARVSRGLGGT